MKAEQTIDKSVHSSRTMQIATMGTTGLVACMWAYFGRLYLIHDPAEWRIANQQLGYPFYIIPLIGVTHIFGAVGLLIPNVPRLTEWVYAGFAFTLLLALYSQLNGGGSTWDKFDPILVMALVFVSYALRRCMRARYEERARRSFAFPGTPLAAAPSVPAKRASGHLRYR